METRTLALALTLTLMTSLALAADPPPFFVFRAAFDGKPEADLEGKPIKPKTAAAVTFAPSETSQAAKLGKGSKLVYDLGPKFPFADGAIEVRFRPDFPQTAKEPERTFLALTGPSQWSLKLVWKPVGKRWIFAMAHHRGWRRELIAWHGCVKAGKWNDLLLTWEKGKERRGLFTLYLNGRWCNSALYDRRPAGSVKLEIGDLGKGGANVAIDELAIYNRPITRDQAPVLAQSFGDKAGRVAVLTKRFAEDDRKLAERRAKVALLKGRIGRLMHHRNQKPGLIKFPEGIVAQGIRPQDIGKVDLGKYKVIYFPEGPRYQVKPEQYKALREWVEQGGGYVGSCQGAYFAAQVGLLDYKCYLCHIWGIFKVTLVPNVVNDFRKGVIDMHFGNGPIMVPGKGCTVAGTYVMALPDGKAPAAIITGVRGKGRIVVFGTHPLGGQVSRKGVRAFWTGRHLETNRMLVNAFLYAGGIIDAKGK